MKNKEYLSLKKMIEYIDKAQKYTHNYTFEEFCEDEKTIDATIFTVSQIGELVKNISEELQQENNHIEWRTIKSLRNRIVHDYEGINLKLIWFIVKNDLIELKEQLEKIIA